MNNNSTITPSSIQEHLDYTLRQFCKDDVWQDEFKYQLAPFRCDNMCVATDSRVMVAIYQSLFPTRPDYPEHNTSVVQRLYVTMGIVDDFEAYAVDDLESLCDECEKLNDKVKDDYKNVIYLAPDAISVKVMRRVILAARLMGATTIVVAAAKQANQMRMFSLCNSDGIGCCVYGIFMPLANDDKYNLHPVSQSIFGPETSNINLEAGMKFRADKEAAEEQARKEYEASKKVWRVQVVKSAWIAVEAVTAEDAMELASKHTYAIDDDIFDDSDVEVEAVETYPMDDDDVDSMSEEHYHKRQGILTDQGFISWSKYYGEDDENDEFHQDRTRVSVSFGK